MRKSCVKVVNNLWKKCVHFFTTTHQSKLFIQNSVSNYMFLHKITHTIHNIISTVNFAQITPLNSPFSTLSTIPTITTKELKIRKVN